MLYARKYTNFCFLMFHRENISRWPWKWVFFLYCLSDWCFLIAWMISFLSGLLKIIVPGSWVHKKKTFNHLLILLDTHSTIILNPHWRTSIPIYVFTPVYTFTPASRLIILLYEHSLTSASHINTLLTFSTAVSRIKTVSVLYVACTMYQNLLTCLFTPFSRIKISLPPVLVIVCTIYSFTFK